MPLLDFVGLVRRGEKLDQPVDGFVQADLRWFRDRLLPLFHSLVARQQQRFGFGVFPLAQQRAAEHRLRVEGGPELGLGFLANGQALSQVRLGLGPFLLLQEGETELGEQAGQLREVLGHRYSRLAQLLLDQVGELGVLARLCIGVNQLGADPAKPGEAFRRLMGFFEEWDRLLEPAGILVVDPEVGHRELRIRVAAAELGLLPFEHVLEQRHGFVELLCSPVCCGQGTEHAQGVGVVRAELGDCGIADAL